jgi:hypothetical protein
MKRKEYTVPDQTHESVVLELQDLTNQCDSLRGVTTDLKEQIKAANVELVAIKLETINLRIETKDLRFAIELLKENLKPLQRFYLLASGLVATAVIGALLALVIIK